MKVGFDISQTGSHKAGCGLLADSLIRALLDTPGAPEFVLYPTFGDQFWDPDWRQGTFHGPADRAPRLLSPADFESSRAFWANPDESVLGNPDIIHANNFFTPRLERARLVWTLHDLLFLDNPEWTTEANRVGCFRNTFEAALRADQIIANSHYSRERFLDVFPHYPRERVHVASPGSRFAGRPPAPRPAIAHRLDPGEFWLSVGTLEPRKNLGALLKARARLHSQGIALRPLALAGGEGWMMSPNDLDAQDVLPLGYVDDTALQWLYENCYAFAFPSLAEGFGMPVVEAMSCGAAVACSRTTALTEVAGPAALFWNPEDVDSIAEGLSTLESNTTLRQNLRDLGRNRAAAFSWSSAAQIVLEVYHRAITMPSLKGILPR